MMRIIQICPYDLNRPGGVRSHILGLSQSLVESGHELVIIGPDSSVDSSSNSITTFNNTNEASSIKFIKIGYLRSAIPLWGTQIDFSFANMNETASIWDFLNDWSPHVVHFHTLWTPF